MTRCQSHHVCLRKPWQAALTMKRSSMFVQFWKKGSQSLKKTERIHPNTNACDQDRNFSMRKKHSKRKVSQRALSEFLKNIFKFYCLVLAVLGLHYCMGFSLVAVSGGYCLVGGFSCCGARASVAVAPGYQRPCSVVVMHRLSCSAVCGIFLDQIHVCYPGRWILYHWATREAFWILYHLKIVPRQFLFYLFIFLL